MFGYISVNRYRTISSDASSDKNFELFSLLVWGRLSLGKLFPKPFSNNSKYSIKYNVGFVSTTVCKHVRVAAEIFRTESTALSDLRHTGVPPIRLLCSDWILLAFLLRRYSSNLQDLSAMKSARFQGMVHRKSDSD